jgi:hypothetical protein
MKKKLFFVEYALVFLLPLGSAYFLYKLDGFRVIVVFFSWLVLGPLFP